MGKFLQKTFGGLDKAYYFRHFVFGAVIGGLIIYIALKNPDGVPYGLMATAVINTFLYPYSRFVYESIMNFIMGDNVFFTNALFFLVSKLIMMLLCWAFAVFVAPVGMLYLYYHHTKHGTFDEVEENRFDLQNLSDQK